jgi:hypothetical protein
MDDDAAAVSQLTRPVQLLLLLLAVAAAVVAAAADCAMRLQPKKAAPGSSIDSGLISAAPLQPKYCSTAQHSTARHTAQHSTAPMTGDSGVYTGTTKIRQHAHHNVSCRQIDNTNLHQASARIVVDEGSAASAAGAAIPLPPRLSHLEPSMRQASGVVSVIIMHAPSLHMMPCPFHYLEDEA